MAVLPVALFNSIPTPLFLFVDLLGPKNSCTRRAAVRNRSDDSERFCVRTLKDLYDLHYVTRHAAAQVQRGEHNGIVRAASHHDLFESRRVVAKTTNR